jgi:23S rRNA (adenine2030-N6)-methyltransferase
LDIRDIVTVELCLRDPTGPDRLNGCGLVVINPPYGFEHDARAIAGAVLDRLGDGEDGASATVTRLADE